MDHKKLLTFTQDELNSKDFGKILLSKVVKNNKIDKRVSDNIKIYVKENRDIDYIISQLSINKTQFKKYLLKNETFLDFIIQFYPNLYTKKETKKEYINPLLTKLVNVIVSIHLNLSTDTDDIYEICVSNDAILKIIRNDNLNKKDIISIIEKEIKTFKNSKLDNLSTVYNFTLENKKNLYLEALSQYEKIPDADHLTKVKMLNTLNRMLKDIADSVNSKEIASKKIEIEFNKVEKIHTLLEKFTSHLFFSQQRLFVKNFANSIIYDCCSRRCGKTYANAGKLTYNAIAKPGSHSMYLAYTGIQARDLIYDFICNFLNFFEIGYKYSEKDLRFKIHITQDITSTIQLSGVSDMSQIEKKRGFDYSLVIIDEAQSIPTQRLKPLIEEIFLPALLVNNGQLVLSGTPPPNIKSNYFAMSYLLSYVNTRDNDKAKMYKQKFRQLIDYGNTKIGYYQRGIVYDWNIFDNEYISDARKVIQDICNIKNIPYEDYENDYQIQREYLGILSEDVSSQVYKITKDNLYQKPENYKSIEDYIENLPYNRVIIGVDTGQTDADAIAVIGYNYPPKDRNYTIYLLDENISYGQNSKEFIEKIRSYHAYYTRKLRNENAVIIVIDYGADGKRIMNDSANDVFANSYNLPFRNAEKSFKEKRIRALSEKIDNKQFFLKENSYFYNESFSIYWIYDEKTQRMMLNSDLRLGIHSDIERAVVYAYNQIDYENGWF